MTKKQKKIIAREFGIELLSIVNDIIDQNEEMSTPLETWVMAIKILDDELVKSEQGLI